MLKLLLLYFCFFPCYGKYQDDDWIDPTDMLNYDAATGRMRNQPEDREEEVPIIETTTGQAQITCLAENKECKKGVENLKQEIEKCRKNENFKPNSNSVFQRYLRKILNAAERLRLTILGSLYLCYLPQPDDSQSEVHYDAEVVLTKEMIAEIQRFLNDVDWTVGALDEALSRTLVNFKHHNVEEWRWKFEDQLGIDLYSAFMIVLCLLCTTLMIATEMWTRVRWFTQIKRLCIIGFVVSIGWNWMYLYKVAFAERQAEVAKMGKFDGRCGERMNWYENMLEWLKSSSSFQNDPCEEYFKSVMINPIFMVPPTKALALTFTDFITEPLKHVGKGIGEFLHNLLAEVPLLYQLPVLILITLVLLVFCYGVSTSVGQINQSRNNHDTHRERLPAGEPQRPTLIFIQGGNLQSCEQSTHRPESVQWHRDLSNQNPEILRAMDVDDKRHQTLLPDFTAMTFKLQERHLGQPQRKEEPLEAKSFGQPQRKEEPPGEKSFGQPQRKEEPPEEKSFGQPQRKEEPPGEKSFEQSQRKEEPPEVKSFEQSQRKAEPPELKSFVQSQRKEEPPEEKSFGQPQRKEEPPEEKYFGQPQRKEEPPEEKSFGQPQRKEESPEEKSFGQPQRKEELPMEKSFGQPQMKAEPAENESFGVQDNNEEPLPNSEHLDKTPISKGNVQQHFPANHTELKLKQMPDVETVRSVVNSCKTGTGKFCLYLK